MTRSRRDGCGRDNDQLPIKGRERKTRQRRIVFHLSQSRTSIKVLLHEEGQKEI